MNWTAPALVLALIWIVFTLVKTSRKRRISPEKIKTSSEVDEVLLKQLFDRVSQVLVDDKLYLKKNFRLAELSEHIGQNEKLVSRAINLHTGLNFNTFVNNYRVEYSKEMMLSGEFNHYTVEAIADESGFSNKVSFYQAFKGNVGISPTEFKAQKQLKN